MRRGHGILTKKSNPVPSLAPAVRGIVCYLASRSPLPDARRQSGCGGQLQIQVPRAYGAAGAREVESVCFRAAPVAGIPAHRGRAPLEDRPKGTP